MFKSHYKTIKQIINEEFRLELENKNAEELRQIIMKDKQKIDKQKQKIQILEKRVHPTQVIFIIILYYVFFKQYCSNTFQFVTLAVFIVLLFIVTLWVGIIINPCDHTIQESPSNIRCVCRFPIRF